MPTSKKPEQITTFSQAVQASLATSEQPDATTTED